MLDAVQRASPHPLHIKTERYYDEMIESRGQGEKDPQVCWTLMTRAEKVLLFLLILALLGIVALATFIITHFLHEENCETEECIAASFKLLKIIDQNVDPCEDFDDFLCGNYIPIDDQKKTNPLSDNDSGDLTTVTKFYQACTNTTAIEEDNEETLSILISHLGGWPLLMGQAWNDQDFNWQRFMVKVRPWGLKSDWLLHFDYYEDENGVNHLLVKPPQLKTTSYQFKTDFYEECITNLAQKFQASDLGLGQLKQMIAFENRLSQISERAQNDLAQDENYTEVTVAKLNEIWPENYLVEILNNLARGYTVFSNSTRVFLASENYLYELHKLMTATPKRTQANYFVWKIVESFLPFMSDDIRKIYGKFLKVDTREHHCHSETIKRFYSIIKEEEIGKYKDPKTLPLLTLIANLTYRSYNESDTNEINVVIEGPEGEDSGVTDIIFTTDKLTKMITEVQFRVDNEFYKCLHKKSDICIRENYFMDSLELEPAFDTFDNTLYLPFSMVYSDSFKWNQPNYINFARIGRTIGDKILEAKQEELNSTLSETGVNLAYKGYIKWLQTNGMEPKLPVLNYTIKQLFWLHSSSEFCPSDDELEEVEKVAESQYFKEDFQCQ